MNSFSTAYKQLFNYFRDLKPHKNIFTWILGQNAMNALNNALDRSALEEFADQLEEMIGLLQLARSKNLNRIRTSI